MQICKINPTLSVCAFNAGVISVAYSKFHRACLLSFCPTDAKTTFKAMCKPVGNANPFNQTAAIPYIDAQTPGPKN